MSSPTPLIGRRPIVPGTTHQRSDPPEPSNRCFRCRCADDVAAMFGFGDEFEPGECGRENCAVRRACGSSTNRCQCQTGNAREDGPAT